MYPQFGVVGNHDHENPHFPVIRDHLEELHAIRLLEKPEDVKRISIGRDTVAIHGVHTLSTFLHYHPKQERDELLDRYIDVFNASDIACNCVLLHNPDGLEFILQRLHETKKTLKKPTLFLAGHTHGAMFDVPLLRHF